MTKEREGTIEQYRGLSTDRGLTFLLNREDGYPGLGALDMLGLTLHDLEGKVLDVGVGGGRSLRHAIAKGIDYYGVDILPLLDVTSIPAKRFNNILEMKRRFIDTATTYPGRMIAADFCQPNIPFAANSFDTVLSAGGLPGYARNVHEAVICMTNMLTVSRRKVAIHGGWDERITSAGTIRLGTGAGDGQYSFTMKRFAEQLREFGISYAIRHGVGPGDRLLNIHFDTTKKSPSFNNDRLATIEYLEEYA